MSTSSSRYIHQCTYKMHNISVVYSAGGHISCLTGKAAVAGTFHLNIVLTRLSGESMLIGLLGYTFTYAQPAVLSMFPSYGPQSGGTMVTIHGQALNIGNLSNTAVFLNGVPCIKL